MKVSVNILRSNGLAVTTCSAMAKGVIAAGDQADLRIERDTDMRGYQACIIYGYVEDCQKVIGACQKQGIPWVFIDLAYWHRNNHYKISVNDRHPTDYFMKFHRPPDRFSRFGLSVKPRQAVTDGYILLAGMSGKAAWSWNFRAEQFENEAARAIQNVTKRKIVYRPKPNWGNAGRIPGTHFDKSTPVEQAFKSTHVVVTHHSNVGCDALLAGIPVISKRGAASVLGKYDFSTVENPHWPTDEARYQFACNLAYCQWSLAEMTDGTCWRQLRADNLVF